MYTNLLKDVINFFGTTTDVNDCGYVTPNGDMIDLSGKHLLYGFPLYDISKEDYKTSHGDFTGISRSGICLTEKYPLLMFNSQGAGRLFMSQTGCIRVNKRDKILEFMVRPTQQQLHVLTNMFYEGTVYIGYSSLDFSTKNLTVRYVDKHTLTVAIDQIMQDVV